MAMFVQWALTSGFGCLGWWLVDSPNRSERLLAALTFGFGGMWLAMFAWVWVRHGWTAARSLTMDAR